jgi:hypothetical protein
MHRKQTYGEYIWELEAKKQSSMISRIVYLHILSQDKIRHPGRMKIPPWQGLGERIETAF